MRGMAATAGAFLQWGMHDPRKQHPANDGPSVVAAPVPSHPLTELIAHEIRERGGWMRFERFMELALYAPGLGYYSGGRRVLGRMPQDGSDFVTAPELTPLFGEVLARQVAQALEATGTAEVWEFGAGTGALAEQLLSELGERLTRYTIVDLSGTLRDRQHQRLQKEHPSLVHKVVWADSLPDALEGVIVGNEVLDAMPVHLMSWDGERWLERGVGLAGSDTPPDAMPDAGAVGDLREARRFRESVILAGHARAGRDDFANLAGRAGLGFGQG